jgi:large subunit ribosomal protein L28
MIARRGKPKYLGGVGRKTTGICNRTFLPNLQRIRVELPDGTRRRMTICTQCIRSGRVKKPSKRQIPAASET